MKQEKRIIYITYYYKTNYILTSENPNDKTYFAKEKKI